MTEEFVNLRSRKNPKARIKLMGGHFCDDEFAREHVY